jgi:hypothetical protein
MPPDEARAAARRHVGNLTQIQERAARSLDLPIARNVARTCATACAASADPPASRWS